MSAPATTHSSRPRRTWAKFVGCTALLKHLGPMGAVRPRDQTSTTRKWSQSMRISTVRRALSALIVPLLLLQPVPATSASSSSKALDEAMSQGGLKKVSVKGIELVYAKPGASLANYKRVRIDPVEVSFDKSWDP